MIRQFVLNTLPPILFFFDLFFFFASSYFAIYVRQVMKCFTSCFFPVLQWLRTLLCRLWRRGGGRQVSWSVWPSINYYGLMILWR